MDKPKVGFRSRLKYVVDNLTVQMGHGIQQMDIAERAGVSRVTLSAWMKPYVVIERLDFGVLHSIMKAVEEIAKDEGIDIALTPEDLIEFVGFPNKIEGLPMGMAY